MHCRAVVLVLQGFIARSVWHGSLKIIANINNEHACCCHHVASFPGGVACACYSFMYTSRSPSLDGANIIHQGQGCTTARNELASQGKNRPTREVNATNNVLVPIWYTLRLVQVVKLVTSAKRKAELVYLHSVRDTVCGPFSTG